MNYCSVCGSEVPDGVKTCQVCGSDIVGTPAVSGSSNPTAAGQSTKTSASSDDDILSLMGLSGGREAPKPAAQQTQPAVQRPQTSPKQQVSQNLQASTRPQGATQPTPQRATAPRPEQQNVPRVQSAPKMQSQAGGAESKKALPTWAIIAIIVGVLLAGGLVGGAIYYKNVYLPAKRDAEAPRYYVMAQNLNMRSTPEFEADYNKIGSFPYGTELLVYDSVKYASKPYMHCKYAPVDARGKVMKDKCVEGYVSYNYMLTKSDFFLLNSIFGNDDARTMLAEARYKRALLDYFKKKGYRGDISSEKLAECGITGLDNAPRWQVFCKYEKAKSNNVYRSRKYRKDSKYQDLAVIIQNIDTRERRLLYFYFDDDETYHLLTEQYAPTSGYMKDRTLKLDYNWGGYSVDVEYEESWKWSMNATD